MSFNCCCGWFLKWCSSDNTVKNIDMIPGDEVKRVKKVQESILGSVKK